MEAITKESILSRKNFYVTRGGKGVYFINPIRIIAVWMTWTGVLFCYTSDGQIINAKYLNNGREVPQERLERLSKRRLFKLPAFIKEKIRKAQLLDYRKLTGRKELILFMPSHITSNAA